MKLRSLRCPECMANVNVEKGREYCYCQYCGTKIYLDDEKKEFTYNKNININKDIRIHNITHSRYTNDADVIRAENAERENKRSWVFGVLGIVLGLGIPIAILLGMEIKEKVDIHSGKISAGYYKDLIGENYKTVEAHFEAAGFTNIELIDLNDSGIVFWNNEKVESISVGGDTSFESIDYFEPDTKVVISYH